MRKNRDTLRTHVPVDGQEMAAITLIAKSSTFLSKNCWKPLTVNPEKSSGTPPMVTTTLGITCLRAWQTLRKTWQEASQALKLAGSCGRSETPLWQGEAA